PNRVNHESKLDLDRSGQGTRRSQIRSSLIAASGKLITLAHHPLARRPSRRRESRDELRRTDGWAIIPHTAVRHSGRLARLWSYLPIRELYAGSSARPCMRALYDGTMRASS